MNTVEKAHAKYCPECSSASLNLSDLSEEVECRSCSWKGLKSKLYTVPVFHTAGSDEQVANWLANELKDILRKSFMSAFVPFLRTWGFISDPGPSTNPPSAQQRETVRQVALYMQRVHKAILVAITEVREQLENERVGASKEKK